MNESPLIISSPPTSAPPATARQLPEWAPIALIAAAVIVCFARLVAYDYTFDDDTTIYGNPHFNPVTWNSVAYYWTHTAESLYVPVTYTVWAALAAVARVETPDVGGITLNPAIFHAANIAVHLATSIVVYQILKLLLGGNAARWPATIGALLFALHPLQLEAVAWISGMKDLLYAMFAAIALWQYLTWAKSDRATRRAILYALATLAFAVSLLSKPTAVALPVIAAVLDLFLMRRPCREVVKSLWPWVAMAVPLALIMPRVQVSTINTGPPWTRPLVALDAIAFYLRKLVAPLPLAFDYGRSPERVIAQHALYWTWIIPLGVAAIILLCKGEARRWLGAAMLLFVAGLLPVVGLVGFQFQYYSTVADHYVYLPMLGAAIAVAWWVSRWPTRGMYALSGAILVVLGAITFAQARHWRNAETLGAQAVKVNPRPFGPHYLIGIGLHNHGDLGGAVQEFRASLALEPGFTLAWNSMIGVLVAQGRTDQAIEEIRTLLDQQSHSPYVTPQRASEMRTMLAKVLIARRQFDDSAEQLRIAVENDPGNAEAMRLREQLASRTVTTRRASTTRGVGER